MTVQCDEDSGQRKNDSSFAPGMAGFLAGQCHFCNFAKVHNWGVGWGSLNPGMKLRSLWKLPVRLPSASGFEAEFKGRLLKNQIPSDPDTIWVSIFKILFTNNPPDSFLITNSKNTCLSPFTSSSYIIFAPRQRYPLSLGQVLTHTLDTQ